MKPIRPQVARDRWARHVQECPRCDARTGNACVTGEVLARLVALAVMRAPGLSRRAAP